MTVLIIEGEILKVHTGNWNRCFLPIVENPGEGIKVRPEDLLKLFLAPELDFIITDDGNVSNSVIAEAIEYFLCCVEISIASGAAPRNISQYEGQFDVFTFLIADDPVNGSLELGFAIRIPADMWIRKDGKRKRFAIRRMNNRNNCT